MAVGLGVGSDTLVVLTSSFNSFVRKDVAPLVYDQVLKHNPVLYRFWRKGPKIDGGASLLWTVMTSTKSKTGWYTGAQQLAHGVEDTRQPAEVNWCHTYADVTIPRTDLLKATTKASVIDLFKTIIDEAILTVRANVSAALYASDSSGLSLDHLLKICDTGTNYNIYANINRTTYTSWKAGIAGDGYYDKTATAATLADFQDVYGRCCDGDEQPTLMIMKQAGYNFLWGQLEALQRYTRDDEMTKAGFESLKFNRATCVVDRNLTTQCVLFINEDFVDLVSLEGDNFVVNPILPGTPSELSINTKITWSGNLRGKAPRYCGQLRTTGNL
jgi:hypothetical protein